MGTLLTSWPSPLQVVYNLVGEPHRGFSACILQNCDTYQSAARQCQEQLQDLRLRTGGRVKQDVLVEWRRDHMLQLHVAGHSPPAPDPRLLRLTA